MRGAGSQGTCRVQLMVNIEVLFRVYGDIATRQSQVRGGFGTEIRRASFRGHASVECSRGRLANVHGLAAEQE